VTPLPGEEASASTATPQVWRRSVATGVGSMPGDDMAAACRAVLEALPDLPHQPELPSRGPGADLVSRAAVALVDLPVDLEPAGWRLVARPGRAQREARDVARRDLDVLTAVAAGLTGAFKLQLAGPWTLAAALERPRGGPALADPGAVRDITASLGEGVQQLVAELRERLPGVDRVVVQLDEPGLPGVLAGTVPTASGFGVVAAVDEPAAVAGLATVLGAIRAAGAVPALHCCAPRPPLALAVAAGAQLLSFDVTLLTRADDQPIGEAVEAGIRLLAGAVPVPLDQPGQPAAPPPTAAAVAARLRDWWRAMGLAVPLGEAVAVTPACGLAGATPDTAGQVLRTCREVARRLAEEDESA
jgi:hypothetical protein